ncbi:imidazolonepropionase [Parvicella tangerina]|uniref:Imidazolonepropionase n=1 Tax=Parvicella tangerina TaxID=2829795 RepID=A0A916JNB5_9FLAO|nr:imidazolonepropionase [Parvicella tangerina]CAG5082537.1 Imidazolonepropionase [Parvicella tangerina]
MKLFKNTAGIYGILENNNSPLRGKEINEFKAIANGYVVTDQGKITEYGKLEELKRAESEFEEIIDCQGGLLLPAYCDSHTHLVFATSREEEFVDRINGLTYEEIALRGGGILNSAEKLANLSEDQLFEDAKQRLNKLIKLGTGAIEIKSGYGLSVEAEIKMLRVIKRLKESFNIPIKATFLGAHAFPKTYKTNKQAYIDLIINEMLPIIAQEGLADYIDAFCEENYFTVEQTLQIIEAGKKAGLKAKIHVNQFNALGGVSAFVKEGAVSLDHLEEMNTEDYDALEDSNTIATALPSCSFFLSIPYTPLKEMLSRNIAIALATDFNPGSTPSGNMNFVVSLACIKQKLTPAQAYNAATINGAYAMEVADQVGSITKGKRANFIVTNPVKGLNYLPYSFGENNIHAVYVNGEIVKTN